MIFIVIKIFDEIKVEFVTDTVNRDFKVSDSSERSALINTSEEMGQARDTSTHVTFNAVNSTSSLRILDSLLCRSMNAREKKRIFKCSVRI